MANAHPAGVTGLRLASEIGRWSAGGPMASDVTGPDSTWATAIAATSTARMRSLLLTMQPILLDPLASQRRSLFLSGRGERCGVSAIRPGSGPSRQSGAVAEKGKADSG